MTEIQHGSNIEEIHKCKQIEIYENKKKKKFNGRNIPTVGYSVGPMSICQ